MSTPLPATTSTHPPVHHGAHATPSFLFPFEPYDIQDGFMRAMYHVLESGGVGVFESPTGTGKSLSIICAALQWLRDATAKMDEPVQGSGLSWVDSQFAEMEAARKHEKRDQLRRRLKSARDGACDSSDEEDVAHAVDADVEQDPQVIYATRTHSQLSQFVREVRRTTYAEGLRVVTLSSRQVLCINDDVLKLGSAAAINEACTELGSAAGSVGAERGEGKRQKTAGCPFYRKKKVRAVADKCLAEIHDIEELVALGRRHETCPYYAARTAVRDAQLVCVPYQSVLHRGTRDSIGLQLGRAAVVFDEGHNVIDAVNATHSSIITARVVAYAHGQLHRFHARYHDGMRPANRRRLEETREFARLVLKSLGAERLIRKDASAPAGDGEVVSVCTPNDYLVRFGSLNPEEMLRYLHEERIANKTMGFARDVVAEGAEDRKRGSEMDAALTLERGVGRDVGDAPEVRHKSFVRELESFLQVLCNPDRDGRIVTTVNKAQPYKSSVKFVLVSPLAHFDTVVAASRAVVLAGGTMEPIEDVRRQLLASMPPDRLFHTYTCGHIVPDDHLAVMVLGATDNGDKLTFNFGNRSAADTMNSLGTALVAVARVVPGGVVVFLASYAYMDEVVERWRGSGCLGRLKQDAGKRVFIERRGEPAQELVAEYQQAVRRDGGAVMLAVMGGKLSEGINFEDEYGRCVVVVGLPYPRKGDPELEERLKHAVGGLPPSERERREWECRDNICMKAVNQSIGRVVRHKGDYACVVLADCRWHDRRSKLVPKLPGWIRRCVRATCVCDVWQALR